MCKKTNQIKKKKQERKWVNTFSQLFSWGAACQTAMRFFLRTLHCTVDLNLSKDSETIFVPVCKDSFKNDLVMHCRMAAFFWSCCRKWMHRWDRNTTLNHCLRISLSINRMLFLLPHFYHSNQQECHRNDIDIHRTSGFPRKWCRLYCSCAGGGK